ncbi:MAG: hypothetical protein GWN00_17350, partial [Aliifodinibius sp.]|nr:hypothetical protein [Fodinibius sp.]NIV12777.1 hypothetical protein [Fodinibius sp.]NIY26502.1 hypothetical protein [Fodinibius sp.]
MNFGISQSSNSLSAILSFVGLMAICLLLSCSCEKSPPTEPPPEPAEPPPQAELTLELVDVGMSEAWLRFGVSKVELPQAFTISRDGGEVFTDSLYTADTLLYDSSLAFNSTYTYRAYRIVDGIKTDSTSLQASTLGATSHNFQWELIEIPSPYGSGVLRDVAIINENDIWAVGKIFADSAQTWLP